MEAARARASEMIAVAEAVGAQRIAASAASVNKLFDEQHPDLAATPLIDGWTSPTSGAAKSPTLYNVSKIASALPEKADLTRLSTKAMDTLHDTSTSHLKEHHGCIYVTVHEAADLKGACHII